MGKVLIWLEGRVGLGIVYLLDLDVLLIITNNFAPISAL